MISLTSESDVAWELVESIRYRLSPAELTNTYVNLNRPEFDAHLLSREGCSHHAEEVRRGVQGPGGAVGR